MELLAGRDGGRRGAGDGGRGGREGGVANEALRPNQAPAPAMGSALPIAHAPHPAGRLPGYSTMSV